MGRPHIDWNVVFAMSSSWFLFLTALFSVIWRAPSPLPLLCGLTPCDCCVSFAENLLPGSTIVSSPTSFGSSSVASEFSCGPFVQKSFSAVLHILCWRFPQSISNWQLDDLLSEILGTRSVLDYFDFEIFADALWNILTMGSESKQNSFKFHMFLDM